MTNAVTAKSGLKVLKPGEILFNDGELADSLFIIQRGQIRLYKPKGKGYIELAVLRAGEVIGEMAYFDEDGSGRKRSCSASALTAVEVVEISFNAFGKTMQSLNPWFKTIINTVVTRLRKTNFRIKELEDNQAVNYSNKPNSYEFMKPIEVMRILGTLFLVFKAHGEVKAQALSVNRKTLTLYTSDMYQIMEVKLESVLNALIQMGWMEIREDDDKLPNILMMKNVEIVRQLFIHYNTERHLPEEKKMRVSEKCETIIGKMLEKLPGNPVIDIPNVKVSEDSPVKYSKMYNLTQVLEDFKSKGIAVNTDHLDDGKSIGILGEAITSDNRLHIEIDLPRTQKMYPIIKFVNAMKRVNQEKAPV